jgi:hypothetical protein
MLHDLGKNEHPSRNQFRLLSATAIAIAFVGVFLDMTGIPKPTNEIIELMKWNGTDLKMSVSNYQTLYLMFMGVFLIGSFSFLGFWKWSRHLLIACLLLSNLMTGVQGVIVMQGLPEAVMGFAGLLLFFPLVLSFYPPCSHYFED